VTSRSRHVKRRVRDPASGVADRLRERFRFYDWDPITGEVAGCVPSTRPRPTVDVFRAALRENSRPSPRPEQILAPTLTVTPARPTWSLAVPAANEPTVERSKALAPVMERESDDARRSKPPAAATCSRGDLAAATVILARASDAPLSTESPARVHRRSWAHVRVSGSLAGTTAANVGVPE